MDRYKDGHLTNNKAETQIMTKPFLKLVLLRQPLLTSINNNSYNKKYLFVVSYLSLPPLKRIFKGK
jgi:hypothetical protein